MIILSLSLFYFPQKSIHAVLSHRHVVKKNCRTSHDTIKCPSLWLFVSSFIVSKPNMVYDLSVFSEIGPYYDLLFKRTSLSNVFPIPTLYLLLLYGALLQPSCCWSILYLLTVHSVLMIFVSWVSLTQKLSGVCSTASCHRWRRELLKTSSLNICQDASPLVSLSLQTSTSFFTSQFDGVGATFSVEVFLSSVRKMALFRTLMDADPLYLAEPIVTARVIPFRCSSFKRKQKRLENMRDFSLISQTLA